MGVGVGAHVGAVRKGAGMGVADEEGSGCEVWWRLRGAGAWHGQGHDGGW